MYQGKQGTFPDQNAPHLFRHRSDSRRAPFKTASFIMRSCSSAASLGSIAFAKSVPSCRSRLSHHRSFSFVGHWRQELSTHGTAARYGGRGTNRRLLPTLSESASWRGVARVESAEEGEGAARQIGSFFFFPRGRTGTGGGREMMGASRSVGAPFGGAVRRCRPPDNATMQGR